MSNERYRIIGTSFDGGRERFWNLRLSDREKLPRLKEEAKKFVNSSTKLFLIDFDAKEVEYLGNFDEEH